MKVILEIAQKKVDQNQKLGHILSHHGHHSTNMHSKKQENGHSVDMQQQSVFCIDRNSANINSAHCAKLIFAVVDNQGKKSDLELYNADY